MKTPDVYNKSLFLQASFLSRFCCTFSFWCVSCILTLADGLFPPESLIWREKPFLTSPLKLKRTGRCRNLAQHGQGHLTAAQRRFIRAPWSQNRHLDAGAPRYHPISTRLWRLFNSLNCICMCFSICRCQSCFHFKPNVASADVLLVID